MEKYRGVWPALVTPLTKDDQVNTQVARRLVDWLIDCGAGGFYVCGGTGEGILLPVEARQLMAETVLEQVNGRVPVIVHVGAAATADALVLARHAEQAGANAVASIPPFYYNVGFEAIKEHYELIAGASPLPLYIYYIPGATGVNVTAAQMWELCQIPNVRGFKYSAFDLYLLERILALAGDSLNVFCGPDQLFAPMLAVGVDGAIGSTYNVLTRHYVKLYDAFRNRDIDEARRLQSSANRVIDVWTAYDLPAIKEMLRMLGFDCGHCRRPFRRLNAAEVARLRAGLAQAGFFELAGMGEE
ncbi:MAG: dihydrodipicolinate synthase family protein [Anaerolineae bacterium]|nr:dihydrodipicolinate synthase family protein [Anaerolineae bacterium]